MGSSAPWTDHEKNVCSRERATISSLVIERGAVLTMTHLVAADRRHARRIGAARRSPREAPLQHNRHSRNTEGRGPRAGGIPVGARGGSSTACWPYMRRWTLRPPLGDATRRYMHSVAGTGLFWSEPRHWSPTTHVWRNGTLP